MALPSPHARNDCGMCRERDADFHVLGEEWNRADTGYQTLLCRKCLGEWAITRVRYGSSADHDQPLTITIEHWPYWRDRVNGKPESGDAR
jgi:hypothetical protein